MTEVSPPSSSLPLTLALQPHQPTASLLPCSFTTTDKENGGKDGVVVVVVVSTNVVQHADEETKAKASTTDKAGATASGSTLLAAAAVPPSPPLLHENGHLPPPLPQQQQQQGPSSPAVILTDMSEKHQQQHNDVKSNDTTTTTTNEDTTAAAFTITSTTVEEHLDRLRHDFGDLLLDTLGEERMAFLPCPDEVTSLLSEAWNKGTGAVPTATTRKDANRIRQAVDRVDRKLKAVQSFFPNLLNYALTSPGFPTVASGADDGAIFQSFGSRVQDAQDVLTALLHQQLVDMQHADYTQRISFYLSFLKSKDYMLQDAHIDYTWPTVDPFAENKEEHQEVVNYREDDSDGDDEDEQLLPQEEMSTNKKRKKATTSRRRDRTTVCRRRNSSSCSTTRGQNRLKRQTYKKRVPFIALFPLTQAGMTIEIWKARGPDHKPTTSTAAAATTTSTSDNNNYYVAPDTTTTTTTEEEEQKQHAGAADKEDCGRIVHLPFGTMALMRGDILHAGGFINNEKTGDPRAHLYVYRDDGELHDLNIKNSYDLPRNKLTQWAAATMAAAAAAPAATTTEEDTAGEGSDTATAATAAAAAATRPTMTTMMLQSPFPSQMKSKHRNKNIVPFSHLYRHHPERLARAERILREQLRIRAAALASKEIDDFKCRK